MIFCNRNDYDSVVEVTCPHCRDRIGAKFTHEYGAECKTISGISKCPNCKTKLDLNPVVKYEVDIVYEE